MFEMIIPDYRRMGALFGDSGFFLDYMRTKGGMKHNEMIIGVRRDAQQWKYQVSYLEHRAQRKLLEALRECSA